MVPTRFWWPYGGRNVFLSGSFSGWTEHYPMAPMEGVPTVFQALRNLPPGFHQYRFFVDGVWRYDEQQPCVTDDFGTVNNFILVRETMDVVNGVTTFMAASPSGMQHELSGQIADTDIELFRHRVSTLLANQTIYDMLPMSSKVCIVDFQMPVKQVFHIMYEEGLAVVPIWDDCRGQVRGMLTASDFILILRELQNNVSILASEELEMHSISAWKEVKCQLGRNSNGSVALHRPLIHVSDSDSLKDVALKIVENEISMVPVLQSSMQDGSSMRLLNLACLPAILKYICRHFREFIRSVPLLQQPICRIPLGTWMPEINTGSGHQLTTVRHDAPLSYALNLLIQARISSIPIVDDNGSLVDVYSRSDIIALAQGDMYARIQLDQMTMQQALDQVYLANPVNSGSRRCPTCTRSSSLHEIMEQLSDPAVRRLVVVEAGRRRVQGIISLRDVFKFLLG